jgi:acyl-CoA synthetase (NDP forming)
VDILIGNSSAVWLLDAPDSALQHEFSLEFLINIARDSQKPMVIFVNSGDPTSLWRVEAALKAQDRCRLAGIPVYSDIQRAARALAHFTKYYRRISKRAKG